jgi:predicted DNA-binding protein with PD1-like motif
MRMKYGTLDSHTWALRLDPGDDIHATLQDFCAARGITNATVSGLGSVDSPTLAHYSMQTKQFTDLKLSGIYEIAALIGNVALQSGQPFAHLHTTVAGPDMKALAGHLVKGECSATLELIVTSYPTHHRKTPNDTIGLAVWDFDEPME